VTERETLIKSLRSMPSSLNDACRTMDAAADFIERRSFDTSAAALVWPEPTVTNPDIAAPTGVPYIDSLIHRLLDAQQDINAEANALMSQSLCDASELVDEIEDALRKLTAAVSRPERRCPLCGRTASDPCETYKMSEINTACPLTSQHSRPECGGEK